MSNLIMGLEEDSDIVQALDTLKRLKIGTSENEPDVVQKCDVLGVECRKGLAEKLLCTKHQGYSVLVDMAKEQSTFQSRAAALRALASLLEKNPDGFDPEGFVVLADGLKSDDPDVQAASLDMTLSCCVLHEMNRQNLVKNGLLEKLQSVVERHPVKVARVWQALVQDDDVRATVGNAHQTARAIVEETSAPKYLLAAIKGKVAARSFLSFSNWLLTILPKVVVK